MSSAFRPLGAALRTLKKLATTGLLTLNASGEVETTDAITINADGSITLSGALASEVGAYLKDSLIASGSQSAGDTTLFGNVYDRNQLALCDKIGSISTSITGAGSVSGSNGLLCNGNNDVWTLASTAVTTTQFSITFDMGALQPNYSNAFWHPFVQYRFNSAAQPTYYDSITVEVSTDDATYYKPSGGQWETTDYAGNNRDGLWVGGDANPSIPGSQWRYCRFTFADRVEDSGYASKASVWLLQLGLRHKFAPFSGTLFRADGGVIYGDTGIGVAPDYPLHVEGAFCCRPGASVTPLNNGDLVLEATSNTSATIKLKGSDGTVRSGSVTLS
ncbi:hypothetical protein GYB59_15275 [bacterium]|nr:hypothetical protein [bacterium]